MQPTGINPSLIRILPSFSPDLLAELLTPGKVLDADVVSVFQDRAILSFGRGVRLEVALQAPLQEGQRVRVQVQAQPGTGAPPTAAAQPAPAQAGPEQPAAPPPVPVFVPRPNPVVQAQLPVTAEVPAPEGQPAQAPALPAPGAEPVVAEQAPAAQPQPAPSPEQVPTLQQQPVTEQTPQTAPQPQQTAPLPQGTTPPMQPAVPQAQQTAPQPQQTAPRPQQTGPQPQQTGPQLQPVTPQPQQAEAAPQTEQAAQPAPAERPAPAAPTTVSAFVARQAASLGTGPQQLLRPVAQPQAGAPQPQPAAHQPTSAPAQQPGGNPPPVVLKVIATLPPDQPGAPATAAKATAAAGAVRETLSVPSQPAPVTNQQPVQQQNTPQVFWLPVPLPDGKQGWAQLHIQEDDSPKARGAKGAPTHEVRIWWETPSLGAVQVTLDAAADKLAALFTAAAPESKGALEALLPELQRRLAQVGFSEARVGCRTAAPGEAVEPARAQGASRLDKRL